MNNTNFGRIVSKFRKKLGLTQMQLAERLNISDKAISKWENGLGYPEITQLPALSEILGVSIDYMLKENSHGIVVAGNILVDVVNMIDKYPAKNMLANISKTVYAVGGCVPNTIINLAKIDQKLLLTAIGKVGNDEHGRYVVSQMKKYGVDCSKVKIDSAEVTSSSNVMTEEETGERTFFYAKGANGKFSIDDIDVDNLDCEIFHIGYILLLDELDKADDEYSTKMARLLHRVSEAGIKTSIDVISAENGAFAEKIIPALKYCSYTIMNEIECCKVSGLSPRKDDGSIDIANIRKTMESFIEYGVKEKVIVHCSECGFLLNSDREFTVVPSLELPDGYIKGSVGAGDAYAAGCLYGIYNGYTDKEILEFAAGAAACSLSESDSIGGMKTRKEIEQINKLYKRRTIK